MLLTTNLKTYLGNLFSCNTKKKEYPKRTEQDDNFHHISDYEEKYNLF